LTLGVTPERGERLSLSTRRFPPLFAGDGGQRISIVSVPSLYNFPSLKQLKNFGLVQATADQRQIKQAAAVRTEPANALAKAAE
jgi:hypothetical protein